jgi:LysM repeat protein
MKSSRGSTPWAVIGIVVMAHVILGSVLLIQGCGTTGPVTQAPEAKMPGMEKPAPVAAPAPIVSEPAPLEAPIVKPEAKTWPEATTTYTIAKGDSLSVICKRHKLDQAEVMALNGIKDANKLRIGQKIILPGKSDMPAADVKKPAKTTATKSTSKTSGKSARSSGKSSAKSAASSDPNAYTVKSGDSLSVIAKKFKTTSAAIRQANNISGDKIVVGQKLTIPGGHAAAAAPVAPAVPAAPDAPAVAPAAPAAPAEPVAPAVTPAGQDITPPSDTEDVKAPAAAAPAPAAPAAPAAGTRSHTVDKGEDLYTVAMMYGVSVTDLKQVNGLNDTALTPGQVLKIPSAQ